MYLITGSTGFLGRELLGRLLIANKSSEIIVIVRAPSKTDAKNRVDSILNYLFNKDRASELSKRVHIYNGDVTKYNFGLSTEDYDFVIQNISAIFHCAATTDLGFNTKEAFEINVKGTKEVLSLANQIIKVNPDLKFNYVSTAYVAGNTTGIVTPDYLNVNGNFRNPYEQSKAQAESLIREQVGSINTTIFRPSIIVGESETGRTSAFNVIYIPAKLIAKGLFSYFPASQSTIFDIVPIDYVADAIVYLSHLNLQSGTCLHLTSGVGREALITEILEVIISTYNLLKNKKEKTLPLPQLLNPELLALIHHSFQNSFNSALVTMKNIEQRISKHISVIQHLVPFVPYMGKIPQFDNILTVNLSGNVIGHPPLFKNYSENIFRYCFETNWGRKEIVFENQNIWEKNFSKIMSN